MMLLDFGALDATTLIVVRDDTVRAVYAWSFVGALDARDDNDFPVWEAWECLN